jgi:hypothetical protein
MVKIVEYILDDIIASVQVKINNFRITSGGKLPPIAIQMEALNEEIGELAKAMESESYIRSREEAIDVAVASSLIAYSIPGMFGGYKMDDLSSVLSFVKSDVEGTLDNKEEHELFKWAQGMFRVMRDRGLLGKDIVDGKPTTDMWLHSVIVASKSIQLAYELTVRMRSLPIAYKPITW